MGISGGLVGVVHLAAMPGDPLASGTFSEMEARAFADARALAEGGVDAIVVENFGSAPFPKGTEGHRVPPHHVAAMTWIARMVKERHGIPVGVNCLRNDGRSAVGIAVAAGLDFVRINVHTGAMLTDQGVIEGEADQTLRLRRELGGDVAILADVLVKHAVPMEPIDPGQATRDAFDRGLADAVIVTGTGTGQGIDGDILAAVRHGAGDRPVFLGSGVTPDNAVEFAALAEGAIVGTWLKEDGQVNRPVDLRRVRELVAALGGRFRSA